MATVTRDYLRLVGSSEQGRANHPSAQPPQEKRPVNRNMATTAGTFIALADGLEDGRVTPRAASIVLREYAKMISDVPEKVDLYQKRPSFVASSGKGWAVWKQDPQWNQLVSCGHAHRTQEAAQRCTSRRKEGAE